MCQEITTLLEEMLHPGMEFTPIPFWFFNDTFEEDKVRRQLADYVEKGVNAFVLHPRIGVPGKMPYLSEAYFEAVRFIVKTASELHMQVVLYDEGMYPSGSAAGGVVEADPEYASKGIILLSGESAAEKLASEPSAQVITTLADGRQIVYGFTHGTIRGIHFGEDDGEPGAPKSADILNPAAVEEFIRLTHDRYYEELEEYFGNTVIAFFTDEPCALGRNAGHYREWTRGLEQELVAAGGRLEELEGLFEGSTDPRVAAARGEKATDNFTVALYKRLIKGKLRETFYARLSDWCQDHGIALIGHPAESDDIEEALYFQIPGQDLIMRRVAPETGGLLEFDSVQAKLSADIARHLGRRRNANECFGVCSRQKIPWYFTASDMKWYIDWLGLRGVNLFIPHAFYYSVEGKRKEERPPDVGPNNIWWKHYRRFSDYIKRLSYLMTDSVYHAGTAVLCDNNNVPYREIAPFYENQAAFNYLPAALLDQARVQDGKVCIGGYGYDRILNLLGEGYRERFGDRFGQWMEEEVEACMIPVVELSRPCPDLRVVHLTRQGQEMYLFGNEGSEAVCVEVKLPVGKPEDITGEGACTGTAVGEAATGRPVLVFVDLWKGICYREEAEPQGAGIQKAGTQGADMQDTHVQDTETSDSFTLRLAPSQTLLVLPWWQPGDGLGQLQIRDRIWYDRPCPDWTERFRMTTGQENQKTYTYRAISGDFASGQTGFQVRGQEMVECYCNGQFVDVSFWGIHCFDLAEYLQEGENEIRLVVTGNMANVYNQAGIWFGLGQEG